MTAPHVNDSQQQILDDLRDAMQTLEGAGAPDSAVFDLLGTLGQARRLAKRVEAAGLAGALALAETVRGSLGLRATRCFATLQVDPLVDAFAVALSEEDADAALDALYDLDLTICALQTAGLTEPAEALVRDACDTVAAFSEGAVSLHDLAARWLDRLGDDGGAAPVWTLLRHVGSLVVPDDLPEERPPAWLDATLANDPLAGILLLVPSRPRAVAEGDVAIRAAASMGGLTPELERIDADAGAGWELVQRHAGAEEQVVVYWVREPAPAFAASDVETGVVLPIVRPASGGEAYVSCSPGAHIRVELAGKRFEFRSAP